MRRDYYFKRKLSKFKRKKHLKHLLLWLATAVFASFLLGIFALTGIVIYYSKDLPSSKEIKNINFTQSTIIFDREGNPLYTIHGEENREIISIKEMSPYIVSATLAVEDQHFYKHHGFNAKRTAKAFYNNLSNKLTGSRSRLEGASTITQQLVKNTFLTPEQTYSRKIKELILSVKLENAFTKDEILEMYLNKIPYGNNAYGIKRASQIYFNTEPKDLTIAQSAILAGLPQAPSRYNPYGPHRYSYLLKEYEDQELEKRNIEEESDLHIHEFSRGLIGKVVTLSESNTIYIRGRSDLVLNMMEGEGYISKEEKKEAWEESQTVEFEKYSESITAPHFVFYVKQLLEEKYGKEMVEKGGLRVYTTLDSNLQEIAEKTIEEKSEINNSQYGATNAALLSADPRTGHILAMVGSADYYNEEISGNVNLVNWPRQPGSAFKPIVYALGFLNRFSPADVVYDVETKFDGGDPPQNFDGLFEGPISFRKALAYSRNIPAIKMYFLAGKQKAIIPFAQKLGITSLDPNYDYGWPISLGTGEITMREMTQAYAVLANQGKKVEFTPILKVERSNGEILEKWEPVEEPEEVLDPQVAYLISDILSDKVYNFGRQMRIEGKIVAAKTGTSNKRINRDKILPSNAWLYGYSTRLVTAVWAGNADGSAMNSNATGYYTAGPIWNGFMQEALKDAPAEEFPKPEGIKTFTVSKSSGKLPGENTPKNNLIGDQFASFAYPTEKENMFQKATIDTLSGKLATPYTPTHLLNDDIFQIHKAIDPEEKRWQGAIDKWAYERIETAKPLPIEYDDLHTADTAKTPPTVQILSPLPFDSITNGFTSVQVKIDAPHGVDKAEYYFDGTLQYTAKDSPYAGKVRIFGVKEDGSNHSIEVKVFDSLQYISSTKISVSVGEKEKAKKEDDDEENIDEDKSTSDENNNKKKTSDKSELYDEDGNIIAEDPDNISPLEDDEIE